MFTPYLVRRRRSENFLPLISGRVMRMRRDTSSVFEGMLPQSASFISTLRPRKAVMAGVSSASAITHRRSPLRTVLRASAMVIEPSACMMREMTNWRFTRSRMYSTVRPSISSFANSIETLSASWCSLARAFSASSSFSNFTRRA